jgi:hypothetical protein
MSALDKNIIITPNVGNANGDPQIVFSAANNTSNAANITLRAYPTSNGTLSFEGSAGQLFSITNNLTGSLFSVNDISGIPSIEVLDTGRVNLAQYNGSVVIGANTSATTSNSNTTGELVVFGGVGVTGNIYVGGTSAGSNGIYTDILRYAANGLPWVMNAGGGGSGLPTTAFSRVVISGQPDAIANIANSPLTLVAGSGISLATNGVANSITITSTGSGGATPSGYLANTIIVANSTGFLSNSNSFFVASNNAIVVPNVVITQAATASFPLSFGLGLGNKIGLYDDGSAGVGYGFGIQSNKLQIFHKTSGDHTSFGHGSSSGFTESFRIASVASAVNYLQVTGNSTANTPALSVQGSDTNVSMSLIPKGTGGVLINQTFSQSTVNVGSTLQVTGNVAANGAIVAQNLYIQGGSNWLVWSSNLQISWTTHTGDLGATTVTPSLVVAPDGTTTAWQLNNSGGQTNPTYGIYQQQGSSTGPWIASVWLRSGSLSSARIMLTGGSDDTTVANTLVTLTSSWQRFVISGVTGLPFSASAGVRFKLSTNAATGNYLVWGPQVELGNPTSPRNVASPYIPTFGSAVIVPLNNNIFATSNISSANVIVSNMVAYANSNNIVSVYQSYNSSTNSLDVVFG